MPCYPIARCGSVRRVKKVPCLDCLWYDAIFKSEPLMSSLSSRGASLDKIEFLCSDPC